MIEELKRMEMADMWTGSGGKGRRSGWQGQYEIRILKYEIRILKYEIRILKYGIRILKYEFGLKISIPGKWGGGRAESRNLGGGRAESLC